ncbi:restriction endonuclease [Actinoplanes sp. NPDC026623]|uniref:restriction endonuclease n=1 Tax=Actinoplanes sp. NPDC026623 TaxID=3155610 RepID=UPI0033DF129F
MASMFEARVATYLRRAGDPGSTPERRGRRYENLLSYLLESVPGCQVQRNTLNYYGTEEVDITVANEKVQGGLRMLPEIFLVECKNWSNPVDSTTLGYFVNVLADRGCSLGVLAAANGITGHQEHRGRAHAIGAAALVRGIRILLITTEDLGKLEGPSDLVALLHQRNLALTAHGSVHLG